MKARDAIRLIEQDGWFSCWNAWQSPAIQASVQAGQGGHCGKASDDLAPGTLNSILKQARLSSVDALCNCDRKSRGELFSVCAGPARLLVTGDTAKSVEREIRRAIRFHIQGLEEDGLPVPEPTSIAEYVET